MNIEILPFSQYHELLQFPQFAENGFPNSLSIVVVARDKANEIKGFWVAQPVIHLEPVWLAPEVQNNLTGHRIYVKLISELRLLGLRTIYCFSPSDKISNYLHRLGFTKLNWSIFKGEIKEE